jgi:hypothetical protein
MKKDIVVLMGVVYEEYENGEWRYTTVPSLMQALAGFVGKNVKITIEEI